MNKWLPTAVVLMIVALFALCWRCLDSTTLLAEGYEAAIAKNGQPPADALFVPVGETMPDTPPSRGFGT